MRFFVGSPFKIFERVPSGNIDEIEMDVFLGRMEENQEKANDLEFIKLAPQISELYDRSGRLDHWAYHSKEISEGTYPLELLP